MNLVVTGLTWLRGLIFGNGKRVMDNGKYVRSRLEQVEALERLYRECPKPSSIYRQQLIKKCPILSNIEPNQIKVWFQNRSCFAIGTKDGFKVFNSNTRRLCYERAIGAFAIVEMLFSSSLLAIVGAGEEPSLSPRRLCLFNTTYGTALRELNFFTSILSVRMNRKSFKVPKLCSTSIRLKLHILWEMHIMKSKWKQ